MVRYIKKVMFCFQDGEKYQVSNVLLSGWMMIIHICYPRLLKVFNGRDDDVFLLLDADELPAPEALLFLKVFDGWTEPVRLTMRWTVFGFFWLMSNQVGKKKVNPEKTEKILTLYAACTIEMLEKGCY